MSAIQTARNQPILGSCGGIDTHVPPFNIIAVLAADSLAKTTSADLSPICTLLTCPQNETIRDDRQR
jgi:hypothetical protein